MENTFQTKACIAKASATSYFLLLGVGYGIMEAVSWNFSAPDFGIVIWSMLPMLANRRWVHLLYGAFNLIFWGYLGIAVVAKGAGSAIGLAAISAVDLMSLAASMLLIYAAVSISEKRFSLI